MIELNQLNKVYSTEHGHVAALDDVSLSIKAREIFGVIGRSGAGKSTLIRSVNLLEKPDSGQVIVDGVDLLTLDEQQLRQSRRQIAMIFQHFNLMSNKTVYDNVAFPLQIKGVSKKEIDDTITPLLELVGIAERKNHYPSQLSGGQKQRVAIARALATKPKILLCDEATSALDPETTTAILKLLQKINHELGLTILLITHEMEVIKQICHRIAVMEHGRVVKQQDTIDFFAHVPSQVDNEFVEAYLNHEIPAVLLSVLQQDAVENTNPVWRICFQGKAVSSPLISHLVSAYRLEVNILQAEINYIQGIAVGIMILEASGDAKQLHQGKEYLQQQGITVEGLGYVPRNAICTD